MDWNIALPLLLIVNVGYIALGGYVFHVLEKPQEERARDLSRKNNQEFLSNFTCVTVEDLNALIRRILKEKSEGIIGADNATNAPNWDLPSSVFFATTVMSTIGYGQLNPATRNAQIFCVFYAILGIPLLAVLLYGAGSSLSKLIVRCLMCKICLQHRRAWTLVVAGAVFLIGVGIWMCAAAALFKMAEGWNYWQGWYYAFITLSTIGFGDLTPGQNANDSQRPWYRVVIGIWIIAGLMWFMTVVCVVLDVHGSDTKDENSKLKSPIGLAKVPKKSKESEMEKGEVRPDADTLLSPSSGTKTDIPEPESHELSRTDACANKEAPHSNGAPNGSLKTSDIRSDKISGYDESGKSQPKDDQKSAQIDAIPSTSGTNESGEKNLPPPPPSVSSERSPDEVPQSSIPMPPSQTPDSATNPSLGTESMATPTTDHDVVPTHCCTCDGKGSCEICIKEQKESLPQQEPENPEKQVSVRL